MNRIGAVVSGIENNGNLHRISLSAGKHDFTVITLELADEYAVGARVDIRFKPAHVALAKHIAGDISIANRIEAEVREIRQGNILAELLLGSETGDFYALTTVEAVGRMHIVQGDRVIALLKASDLYLSKTDEA